MKIRPFLYVCNEKNVDMLQDDLYILNKIGVPCETGGNLIIQKKQRRK